MRRSSGKRRRRERLLLWKRLSGKQTEWGKRRYRDRCGGREPETETGARRRGNGEGNGAEVEGENTKADTKREKKWDTIRNVLLVGWRSCKLVIKFQTFLISVNLASPISKCYKL